MGLKLANNAISFLSSSLGYGDLSLSVRTGEGSKFPTLAAGDYFPATISKTNGQFEIVRVTARSGDTFTITRAQEGTSALDFDANALVELRLTAATVEAVNTLALAALPKSGGVMTGNLEMGAGTKIVMEGTSDDAFETTIDPGNPTDDRTLTLPDKSGTLATNSDVFGTDNISDGSVTPSKLSTGHPTWDASGNLGLGVTPSAWSGFSALQVGAQASLAYGFGFAGFANNAYHSSAGWKYIANAYASNYQQVNGSHIWNTAPSGTAGDAISFTQAMTLNASGNLGIGTSSPIVSAKLSVSQNSGVARVSVQSTAGGNSDAALYLECAGTNSGEILYSRSGQALTFLNGGAERMRIDSSGNLLVGATGRISNERFSAASSGNAEAAVFTSNGSFATTLIANYGVGTRNLIQFRSGLTDVGNITSNGSTTSYNTTSDYRLKENIQPMQSALAVVQQLNPVTYTWKTDGSAGQGFIAHELQAVVPDCVTGEKDGTRIEQYEVEPERTVTVVKQRQKTQKVIVKQHQVDMIDGVATLCVHDVEVDQPVVEQRLLFNEDGTPVMEIAVPEQPEVLDEAGNVVTPAQPAVMRQATVAVPAMEDYEAEETIPAVMGEREVPAYQGIDTSFLVGVLTKAIQELKAELDEAKQRIVVLEA